MNTGYSGRTKKSLRVKARLMWGYTSRNTILQIMGLHQDNLSHIIAKKIQTCFYKLFL